MNYLLFIADCKVDFSKFDFVFLIPGFFVLFCFKSDYCISRTQGVLTLVVWGYAELKKPIPDETGTKELYWISDETNPDNKFTPVINGSLSWTQLAVAMTL